MDNIVFIISIILLYYYRIVLFDIVQNIGINNLE